MIMGEISEFRTFSTRVNSQYSILLMLVLLFCYPTFGTTACLIALLCVLHAAPRLSHLYAVCLAILSSVFGCALLLS